MDKAWTLVLVALAAAALPSWLAVRWHRRWQLERRQTRAERQQVQQVFDALDIGLLVFDAEDRVHQWNADYERLYPTLAGRIRRGLRFEDMLRGAVHDGVVPEAAGREEAWIAERVAQHRRPQGPILRRMQDGRWRRITERYLADGGMLSYSIDVTTLVEQGEALKAARAEAEASRNRLLEALEVLPAGIEWFDADDRLVLANGHSRALFPRIAELLAQHPTFEQLVRANHAAGGLPNLPEDIDTWLQHRLQQRRAGDNDLLLNVTGRWIRLYERRTADGGIVNVRVDVTEEVTQREAAEANRQRLHEAIDALPDGFALYDADDRLILCNERYRTMYRESGPALQPGTRFEDVLRYGLAHGQYPQAAGREETWLAERLRAHREPGPPLLQELPGNRWLRIDERRTRSGGVAGVRADVTAMVRREQTLAALNHDLDQANARLADLLGQDTETGAANATALRRALDAEWARARRHGPPLAVLVVALEAAADAAAASGNGAPPAELALRQALARALGRCARRPGDLVARVDPDGFALLLPHTGSAGLPALRQRCLEVCRSALGGHAVRVGAAASDDTPAPASAEALYAQARDAARAPEARAAA